MLKLYAHRISGWIAVTLLFAVLLFPMSISAQQIVLQAKTGTVRVEGKLLNFDGEFLSGGNRLWRADD